MTIGSSLVRLQSLEDEEINTTQRINELQSILSDTSTSIVKRSKAKVELATLQKNTTNLQRRASIQKLGGSGIVKNRRESSEDQSQSTAATTNDDGDVDINCNTFEQQPSANNNNNKRVQLNNKKYRRTSLQNLQTSGLVTKNTALLNAREKERIKQQQLIKELHDMLHNNAKKLSAAKRLELEEQLRVAEERLVEVMEEEDDDVMGVNSGSGRASSVPDSYGYGVNKSTMDTSYDEQGRNGDTGFGSTPGDAVDELRPVQLQRTLSIETMEQSSEERHRIKVLEGRVTKLSIELKQQEKEDALVQSVAKSLLDSHNKGGGDLDGLDLTSMLNGGEEDVHVIPTGAEEENGVRSQYNLEEQLHLAQEAITAIEALDNERIEEVELINHMLGGQEKNNGKRMQQLEQLVLNLENAMLQHNKGERELTIQLTDILGERIRALDRHVANLVGEADDEDNDNEKTLAYYKAKSERLEIKCFSLEGDLEECDITIAELKEWKKLQGKMMYRR